MEIATPITHWVYKGSALYQIHLVKAATARAIIPKELRLVEAFGYTLGGFVLIDYKETPFGPYQELVTLAGIVREPATPKAYTWVAGLHVNSDKVCNFENEEAGFQAQVATFSKSTSAIPKGSKILSNNNVNIRVAETDGPVTTSLYDIVRLKLSIFKKNPFKWLAFGPKFKLSLPILNGLTKQKPQLLKSSCQIECRVKPTFPAIVLGSLDTFESENQQSNESLKKKELCMSVMLSRPIFALEFNCLELKVQAPPDLKGSHDPLENELRASAPKQD